MSTVIRVVIDVRADEPELAGLGAAARELWHEAVRLSAAHYGSSVIRDLALAAKLEVSIRTADELIAPGMSFTMTVGGEPVRLDYRRGRGRVVQCVADELYRNRALFVTRDVAAGLVADVWPGVAVSEDLFEKLLELMRACMERNLSIERLRALLRKGPVTAVADPWELLFSLHDEQTLRLGGCVNATRIAKVKESPAGSIEDRAVALQNRLFEDLGFVCPIANVEVAWGLGESEWQLQLNDLRLPVRSFAENDDFAHQVLDGLEAAVAAVPLAFFTRAVVERNLDLLCEREPLLVGLVVERFDVNAICHVAGALVQERVAVHSLHRILDAMSFVRGSYELDTRLVMVFDPDAETPMLRPPELESDPIADLIRAVRKRLKREITYRYADRSAQPTIVVHLLESELEHRIRIAKKKPFTAGERLRIMRGFSDAGLANNAVVLTHERDAVRSLIGHEFPDVAVIAYDELSPETTVQPVNRIEVSDLNAAK